MPCSEGRIGHGVLGLVVHGRGLLAQVLLLVLLVLIILGGIASWVPARNPAGFF